METIPLHYYLILAATLFSISIMGIFLNRKNVVILLMCIELMLLAVNINSLITWVTSPGKCSYFLYYRLQPPRPLLVSLY